MNSDNASNSDQKPQETSDKGDIVPRQPSELSNWRLEEIKDRNPFHSFEYHFRLQNIWKARSDVREWLEENEIYIDQSGSEHQLLVEGLSTIRLIYYQDSEGEGMLKVNGHQLAFHHYCNLIEILREDESPIEYEEAVVYSGIGSAIETPYPMRFEFILNPKEPYHYEDLPILQWVKQVDWYEWEEEVPYPDISILEWINRQEVVKFLDENEFKEPGDDHPKFIRIRENSEGKPILILEGYNIGKSKILDCLLEEESPFEFHKSYVVGREMKDIPHTGDSK